MEFLLLLLLTYSRWPGKAHLVPSLCSRQQNHIVLYKPVVLLLDPILAVFTATFGQLFQDFPL